MIKAIMKMARGDYSVQLKLSGKNDELDSLAMGINMMIDDINYTFTERKKTEKELENIFYLSPDMIVVCTPEGKFVKVNPVCERILGYTTDEILKLDWTKLVHPDDVGRTNKEVGEQLKGKSIANFINRFKCKDGSYKTLEWQATPVVEGIIYATARDVTERMIVQEEAENASTYINAMGDGLIVIDMQKKVVKLNKATEKLLGYSQKDIPGLTLEDFTAEEELQKQYSLMKKCIETGVGISVETVLTTKQQKRIPVMLSGSILRDNQGTPTGFVGVFRDISERKESEKKQKNLNERLKVKVSEMERFSKFTIGREIQMIELKKEINELCEKLGEKVRYDTKLTENEKKSDL